MLPRGRRDKGLQLLGRSMWPQTLEAEVAQGAGAQLSHESYDTVG